MSKKIVNKLIYLIGLLCCQMSIFADTVNNDINLTNQEQTLGTVAQNLDTPITFLEQVFNGASIIIGVFLLCSAVIRYMKFRQNPQESPISFVVIWLLLGITLIVLPFMHQLTLLASHYTGVAFEKS